ncbi:MAG TPA: aspartate dehydrogenase [Burkholderiales bacterium]|nr:aspartate dehydrogenase [Burkholderiales bacterium]
MLPTRSQRKVECSASLTDSYLMTRASEQRVAIAGLGAIGRVLARKLDAGVPGMQLTAVAVRNPANAAAFLATLSRPGQIVSLDELPAHADIVIECAPAALLAQIAEPALKAGKQVIVLSVGALLANPQLQEIAAHYGGQILVPTGALLGLDAVLAAAEGTIHEVRMTTRKPPRGLIGAPYLIENDIDISDVKAPLRVFSGTARDAAQGFPANVNVAAALSLAGIGPDRTMVEIWADPTVTRNTHRIEVDSDAASFNMTIENIPSENPKTGRITAQSVLALLRKLSAPLRVGT